MPVRRLRLALVSSPHENFHFAAATMYHNANARPETVTQKMNRSASCITIHLCVNRFHSSY